MHRLRWFTTLVLFIATVSYSQTFRGTLSGTVTDVTGAAIGNVSVQLTNPASGAVVTFTTNSAGDFSFPELSVGKYNLNASFPGFTTKKIDDIDITVSKVTNLRIQLEIGKQDTIVDVVANGVQTDTTSSSLVALIDSKSTQEIPLNGRNFTQMVTLSAGVNISKSVNGSRTNSINYQVDGSDNNDPWSNAVASNQGGVAGIAGGLIPIEAIDQFSMQNNAEADMGRNAGANSNMVLRSGGNQIHGDVFYFDRNEYFASRSAVNLSNSRIPEIRNHQGGFTLGGPIWKDHTFLFLAGEIQIANANNNIGDTVLSDGWVNAATSFLAMKNYNQTVYNPAGPNQVSLNLYHGDGTNPGLFPANTYSLPATTSNYLSAGRNSYNSYNGVIKLDHHFNDKEYLSIHYIGTTGTQTADVGSHYADYFQKAPMHIHNFSVVQSSILRTNLVNQITFAAGYFLQTFNDANQNFNPAALGLNLGLSGTLAQGAPQIAISGFDYTGATAPLGRTDVTGHVTDSLHWTIGKHSLKLGGEYRHANVNVGYYTNGRGVFKFDGSRGPWHPAAGDPNASAINAQAAANCATLGFTSSSSCSALESVADFIAGQPSNSSGSAAILRNNPQRVYLVNSFDVWAQDSWQVSDHLTLNYGARFSQPGVVSDDRKSLYSLVPATGYRSEPLFNKDWTDFAPRVGFAYTPRNDTNTVIRGAYGWFYDQPTVGQFVYNNIGNGGATGIYSNPTGSTPVYQVNAPTNATFAFGQPVFGSATASSLGAFSINPNFKTAYLQNFNLNVEQQLARNTLLTIGYVGSLGRRLGLVYDINQPINGVRPYASQYPSILAINQVNSSGTSNFHSLQVSLRQAAWHGISATAYYTLGKAMDYTSSVTTPMNSYDLRADYGPSTFDSRNSFTGFAQYSLPQLGHFVPVVTKGWQLNALYQFSGGTPINFLAGTNISNTSEGKDRPNYVGGPIFAGKTKTVGSAAVTYQYITKAAFASPICSSACYGNATRDMSYGPGYGDVDFSVFKHTPITEKVMSEFRVEIFNIANQANFANPSGTVTSSSFGALTQTRNGSSAPGLGQGEPRNIQFALKLSF
jgi:hypothetical protein